MTYQECEEWGIPYFPNEEEMEAYESQAQYDYEVMRQLEIDEEANNVKCKPSGG